MFWAIWSRCRPVSADSGLSIPIFARLIAAVLALAPLAPAFAADDTSKLPVPRFVSMKHGDVNLRVGPGRRYPIEWVYRRRDMPVEIVQEFDVWRRIRDWEGTTGWVIEQAVSGTRTFIVTGAIRVLRGTPDPNGAILARVEPGVIGRLLECPERAPEWCRVEATGLQGWIRRTEFWGVYPQEFIH